MLRLTLYTRPGCHLCDAMKRIVDDIARDAPVSLREIDITGNAGAPSVEIPGVGTRGTGACQDDAPLLDALREACAPSARVPLGETARGPATRPVLRSIPRRAT